MSDSSGISGDKQTYLDGTVSNHGNKTVTGITVQVAFQDYNGHPAAIDTMPLTLIRFLKPYVDTVPVSMAPIQPGQSRSFRLIFDATPQIWGGADRWTHAKVAVCRSGHETCKKFPTGVACGEEARRAFGIFPYWSIL
jgi:hypothetical protein